MFFSFPNEIQITSAADLVSRGESLCRPTQWSDTVVFFLLNYAATLVAELGVYWTLIGIDAISIGLFPTARIIRRLNALFSYAIFARNDLDMAARSGAECTMFKRAYEY